tara:strand:+ start:1277 stop:1942 length:666 start_codon:yes stop_codon:yes gene_type:complete
MTHVYWGSVHSKKRYLQNYATINNKSWCKWDRFTATKFDTTDVTKYFKVSPRSRLNNRKGTEEKELFLDIKRVLPVDIIFPLYCTKSWEKTEVKWFMYDQLDANIEFFNTCNNIVPYNTDLKGKAQSLLDKWDDYMTTPLDIENKNTVYQYLDDYIFNIPRTIEKWLRDNNIEYNHFDIDKGKYIKLFGWYKIESVPSIKDVYGDIVDEWLSTRDDEDTRL